MDILTRRSQIRHPPSKSLILNETHQLLDDCEEHFGQIKLNEQEKQKIDTLAVFPTVGCISTPRHDRTYSVRHPSIAYYSQVKGIFNGRSLRTLIYLTFIGVEAQSDISSSRQPLALIVQELCESRGGRPGLSVLTSLLVSVDVKIYCTVLRHWSKLVPNMSTDI